MNEIVYQDETGEMRELNPAWVRISGLPLGSEKTYRLANILPRPEKDCENLERAIRTVKAVVDGEIMKPVLLYSAEKGLGKTHLAIAACWMALSRGKTVAFYPVASLLDELRQGYKESEKPQAERDGRTYESIMSWLQRVHLLVLDDIGLNKYTEWADEKLDQIVDYRYLNDKPLILTSNSIKFSDRIVSRCKEGALIRLKGTDYRGSQQQKRENENGK